MKARRVIRRVAEGLSAALLVVLVAFNAYIMICGVKGRAAVIGGHCILRIETGSMEPSLHVGDYILVASVEPETIAEGDIISFYSDDPFIAGKINTHRVTGKSEQGFLTKGDANMISDRIPVPAEKIIGVYCRKMRFLCWLGSFASLRKLLLLAVVLMILGMSAYEVVSLARIRPESDERVEDARERRIQELIEQEKKRLYAEHFSAEEAENSDAGTDHETEDVHRDRN